MHAYIGSTARTPSYLDTYKEDLPKYCLSLSLVLCVCVCVCARVCVCVCVRGIAFLFIVHGMHIL